MFRGRHEKREEQRAEPEKRNGHLLPGVEAEFRELVHRGSPRSRTVSGSGDVQDLNSLVQSLSGPVVLKIEKLITQLHDIRDHLVYDGQRIQRAITEYAQTNEAAINSSKIIAENLARWTAEYSRTDRANAALPQTEGTGSEPPAEQPRDPGAGPH